jgi:hypothetical protein
MNASRRNEKRGKRKEEIDQQLGRKYHPVLH